MHIVVLGSGTIGTSIAELLCEHRHNVVLVDSSRRALEHAEEERHRLVGGDDGHKLA